MDGREKENRIGLLECVAVIIVSDSLSKRLWSLITLSNACRERKFTYQHNTYHFKPAVLLMLDILKSCKNDVNSDATVMSLCAWWRLG